MVGDCRDTGEVAIDTGEGDGCGVRILTVEKDFCGVGARTVEGSELTVKVSLVVRE